MNLINKINKICRKIVSENKITYQKYNNSVIVESNTYDNFVNRMINNNWCVNPLFLNKLSILVNTYKLNKNEKKSFLEIECPETRIITICGLSQCKDLNFFIMNPNLCDTPHNFSIECTNENGDELSDDCIIDIITKKPSGEFVLIDSIPYMDISLRKNGKLKEKQDRYYFKKSIILYSAESLIFKTISNIDITKVNLYAKADIFTKEIKYN